MSKIYNIKDEICFESGGIVSQRLFSNKNLELDLYALDVTEELDKEKRFGDSLVWILEGEISLFCEDEKFSLKQNEAFIIEKETWRKIVSEEKTKMILIDFKENTMINHLPKAEIFALTDAIEYQDGKVVSKTLVKNENGTMTLMSFHGEQELSTHAAPGDALLVALEGELALTIGDENFNIKAGDSIVMPGKIPHGLKIKDKFKMLLIVTRDK
ncbi:cupin domain-containing protein [Campylobacter sp. RM15925]|uniref:cupin domain-containing protein n=1 Tax=Campylobacter sp. RM15925 TaxID=1705724 RepID=UPI0014752DA0|nr:cupin domain-containing protein [Campylobacter sp. RM15925]